MKGSPVRVRASASLSLDLTRTWQVPHVGRVLGVRCVGAYSRGVPIRVVFGEDNYLVRQGVLRVLELETDIEVTAVCEDLPSLNQAIDAQKPDVVLTDIRMPPTNLDEGIQVADRVRQTSPETGVVVLSQFAAPEYALALLSEALTGAPTCSRIGSATTPSGSPAPSARLPAVGQ